MKKNIRSFAVFLLAVTTFEGAGSSTNEPWVNTAPQRLHSVSPEVECLFVENGEQVFRALQSWKHTPIPESVTSVTSKNLTDPTLDISFDDVVEKLNIPDLLYAPVTAGWMPSMLIRSWNKSTDDAYNQDRKHRLFSIISLCWYLDKIACTQENVSAISRGSWTLIEAQQNILHYLTDYVRLVTGTPNPKNQAFFCTQSNFAYRRDPNLKGSSHHAGRSPESQFGIDMRLEADQGILKLLPYSHTHILFSQIVHPASLDTPALLTFIKMEPLGMGSAVVAAGHGVNFLESKKAVADTARREKDIPPAIVKQYANIMHLEVSQVRNTTIAQMCCNIKKYCMEKSECDEKFNEFVDFCKQNKLDNPMVRTGNEVVLDCRSITKVEQCL
ncbi:MAG: hypothetical protein COY39_00005 [Alphaproteobacteria bacterium CG_4_10_14_0_8_um_filter_37_21]|nr:MAG: hypothetical protein COY39_00005 [Alphaproteobacteria bacterium CG_4_10_14_0_8_um_filter_37_21]